MLISLLLVCGCSNSNDQTYTISSDSEYQKAFAETRELSHDALIRHEEGEPLSSEDTKKLTRAAMIFAAMTNYSPDQYGAYLGQATILQALGNNDSALQILESNQVHFPEKLITQDDRYAVGSWMGMMSNLYFLRNEYDKALTSANDGLALAPNDPNLIADYAQVHLQQKNYTECGLALDRGQKLEPNNRRLKQLRKLLSSVPQANK